MLTVFLGTDTKKALAALNAEVEKKKASIIRLTDTSSVADVEAGLSGGGMFAQKRTVVLDRISDNEALWPLVVEKLPFLAESSDDFFIYEEKPLVAEKRILEKHAADSRSFDLPKSGKERPSVFSLVNHMRAGDKKKLWVGYQQELAQGNAPEAIHGVLFWGVKQMLLAARSPEDGEQAKKFIIELTELPHESRRGGEELEYALERFILTAV